MVSKWYIACVKKKQALKDGMQIVQDARNADSKKRARGRLSDLMLKLAIDRRWRVAKSSRKPKKSQKTKMSDPHKTKKTKKKTKTKKPKPQETRCPTPTKTKNQEVGV